VIVRNEITGLFFRTTETDASINRRSLMTRWIGKRLRDWLASRLPARLFTDPALFGLYERRGWHITPVHYYQPIPDSRELPNHFWSARSSMCGVDINEQFQLVLLKC
jgi:hypothetical protein